MTDQAELQRVREIHAALDSAQFHMAPGASHYTMALYRDPSIRYTYTAEEVRAWPAMKKALMATLTECNTSAMTFWSTYERHPAQHGCRDMVSGGCQEAIARGLVVYREMLATAESAAAWRDGVKGERLAAGTVFRDVIGGENVLLVSAICEGMYIRHDESATLLRYREPSGRETECLSTPCRGIRGVSFNGKTTTVAIDPATDAPEAFKSKAHRFNDEQIAAMTQALPANEAARKRLVAALGAEMRRPVTARFPAEGRSERALPVTNGRKL